MALMMILGREDLLILWLMLLVALGLTFTETRELKLDTRMTLWWLSVVAMTHVVGYLALRAWGYQRRRGLQAESGATS